MIHPIPIPENQKCVFLKGGYIEDGYFIPTDEEWMFSTTDHDPRKGIFIRQGNTEFPKLQSFFKNGKGEWENIDNLK